MNVLTDVVNVLPLIDHKNFICIFEPGNSSEPDKVNWDVSARNVIKFHKHHTMFAFFHLRIRSLIEHIKHSVITYKDLS